VVTWGDANGGGDSSAVQGELITVVKVVGNSNASAALTSAIRTDGSVVAWGHDVSIAAAGVQFARTDLTQVIAFGSEPPVALHNDDDGR
jgi:tRNA U38,U39,U40 pseudouridine synthase TruA